MWPANLVSCRSLRCGTVKRYAIPQDDEFPWIRPNKKLLRRALTNDGFSTFSSEIHDLSRDAVDVAASAEPISGNDSPDSGHVGIVSVVTADKEASHVLPPNPFRLKPGEASSLDKTSHSKLQYIMVPIEPLAIKRKCEACQQPHKPDAAPPLLVRGYAPLHRQTKSVQFEYLQGEKAVDGFRAKGFWLDSR